MFNRAFVISTILISFNLAQAAPKAELWARWQNHEPANKQKIDHSAWDRFLKSNLITAHPSGINRVRYQTVGPEGETILNDYLRRLQSIAISSYSRDEQMAFWINLYNALTVDLILSRFPVASIRDINISPGLLERGPWGAKLISIEGERISLDDIEHRILRPIWKDARIHYALSWASLGGPNLQPTAYSSDNLEGLLEKSAREFVNHPRGVSIQNGKLRVSSLYVWFQEDFGRGAEELMAHWQQYANPPLAEELAKYQGRLAHDYDWRLNDVDAKP